MNSESRTVARRLAKAGCASLLALPAALSLGAPGLAQSVPGAVLLGGDDQVESAGIGISLGQGGAVVNEGQISAGSYGVLVNGGAGSVTNSGQISAGYDGVSLNRGGSVSNEGTIFGGHIGVYTGNGLGSVRNSGTISARSGDAVSLYSGGALTNTETGALLGGYSGVYAGGGGSSITNAGLITGPLFGAYLMGEAAITNSGTVAGGTVENEGLIQGGQMGVQFAKSGRLDNAGSISGGMDGVKLGQGGTLTNEAGGVISGGSAGVAAGAGDVIVNDGRITGLTGIQVNGAASIENAGVIAASAGGDAISLNGGASSVTFETGSGITGAIAGNDTASLITLAGHGSLSVDITGLRAGQLAVQPGAAWTVSGNWVVGRVVNAGVLTAGQAGTPLTIGGDYVQTSTGTLRVLVTPMGMNHLAVSGSAHLAGGLAYMLSPGTYAPASYTFLTAPGGISGDFATVESSGTTENDSVSAVPPVAVASTLGGEPVAAVLSVTRPLVVAPPDGVLFADAGQAMALAGAQAGQALLDHDGHSACTSLAPQGSGAGNVALALASGLCRMGGWLQFGMGDLSTDGAYDSRGGGFLAGLDRKAGAARLGVAVGYDAANLKDEAGGKAFLETVRLGLYGGLTLGHAALSAALMDGLVSTGTTRVTGAGNAAASGHGNVLTASLQAVWPFSAWGGQATPAAGLQITHLSLGALPETAAAQALAVRTQAASGNDVAPYLRLSVFRRFLTTRGLEIMPDAMLGLTVNATTPGTAVTMTAQDGTRFSAAPVRLSPVSGQAGLGLSIRRGQWRLSARYAATLAGNWHAQSLQVGLLVNF